MSAEPATEPLRLRCEGAVGVVEIDSPPANALGWQLYGALEDLLPQLAGDTEIRAVVFASANPKIFVAGADLRALGPAVLSPAAVASRLARAHRVFSALEALPKPTVAAIDGHAMGGGCELALCLDFRVMGRGAPRIGLPEASLGLMPGAGGTQRLARLVGRERALRLMMLAERLDADEAERIGLVSAAEPGAAAQEARGLAERLAKMPVSSLRGIKRAVGGIGDGDLAREREAAAVVFAEPEAAAGIAAFLARQRPRFHDDD